MSSGDTPVELSRRLTRVNIAYTIARMKVIEARSGQPVEMRRFGDAAALMARQVPSPHFNAVVGLRGGQGHLVGELDDWYRANGIKGRFVVAPGDLSAELGRALAARGYAQTDFDTVLYAAPPPAAAADTPFEIVAVDSPAVMDEFLDALLTGWGVPPEHRAGAKANMSGWLDVPAFRLYLIRIDGRPAAAAKTVSARRRRLFPGRRDRSGFPRPRIADRIAASPYGHRGAIGRRADLQPGGVRLGEPSQHGAHRVAGALHALHLDALTENTRCASGLLRSSEPPRRSLNKFLPPWASTRPSKPGGQVHVTAIFRMENSAPPLPARRT